MMKITAENLRRATELAEEILALEAAKDRAGAAMHLFHYGAYGAIKVPVPAGSIRAEITVRIEAATKELAVLGFELLPSALSPDMIAQALEAAEQVRQAAGIEVRECFYGGERSHLKGDARTIALPVRDMGALSGGCADMARKLAANGADRTEYGN